MKLRCNCLFDLEFNFQFKSGQKCGVSMLTEELESLAIKESLKKYSSPPKAGKIQ